MFLLLVVERHLTQRLLQADGDLAVVGDALRRTLLVLIETHLLLVDHTEHVVPGPEETESEPGTRPGSEPGTDLGSEPEPGPVTLPGHHHLSGKRFS